MTNIKVMLIQDLLHIPYLKNSYHDIIIFITTKPNYYDFGHTEFFQMNIADDDKPIVSEIATEWLKHIIRIGQNYDNIFVCCDAGLSRSPAIALYLAYKLGEKEQFKFIEHNYRFLNYALVNELLEC